MLLYWVFLFVFFVLLFQFCSGIFRVSFLTEELLNSTSYKYSQVSNSDVPVISSIESLCSIFFCVLIAVLWQWNMISEILSRLSKYKYCTEQRTHARHDMYLYTNWQKCAFVL